MLIRVIFNDVERTEKDPRPKLCFSIFLRPLVGRTHIHGTSTSNDLRSNYLPPKLNDLPSKLNGLPFKLNDLPSKLNDLPCTSDPTPMPGSTL